MVVMVVTEAAVSRSGQQLRWRQRHRQHQQYQRQKQKQYLVKLIFISEILINLSFPGQSKNGRVNDDNVPQTSHGFDRLLSHNVL